MADSCSSSTAFGPIRASLDAASSLDSPIQRADALAFKSVLFDAVITQQASHSYDSVNATDRPDASCRESADTRGLSRTTERLKRVEQIDAK